jgi:hypothetical protein
LKPYKAKEVWFPNPQTFMAEWYGVKKGREIGKCYDINGYKMDSSLMLKDLIFGWT